MWFWLASLAIDVVGTLTVARAEWRVSPSHFAETARRRELRAELRAG